MDTYPIEIMILIFLFMFYHVTNIYILNIYYIMNY